MKTRKILLFVIAVVMVVGMAWKWWPDSAAPSEEPQVSESEETETQPQLTEGDLIAESSPAESSTGFIESELIPRTSQPLAATQAQQVRQRVSSREPFPPNVSMDQYKSTLWEQLQENPPNLEDRDEAQMDAELAYAFYMYYGNCSVAPLTEQELDQRINQITARTRNASEEYLRRVETSAERTFDFYEFCSAIPAEEDARLEAVRWMGRAVYLGHPIAEAQYYEKAMGFILRPNRFSNYPPIAMIEPGIIDEFKSTAHYAFNQAVTHGHPEAYVAISQAYLDDVLFQRDPVIAMAWVRVAELEAMKNRVIESRITRQRDRIAAELSPDQIADSENLAQEIRMGNVRP